VRPSARSYPASNIGSTATSTTTRKILTNRPASGNSAYSGLNLPDTPSASFPPMVPSRHTSDLAATGSMPQRIARRWVNDSRSGEKSRTHRSSSTSRSLRQNRSDSQTPWLMSSAGKRRFVSRLGEVKVFMRRVCHTAKALNKLTMPLGLDTCCRMG
jgi:hypothetical protein